MKNLSVIIASLDDISPDRRGFGIPVRFPSNFNQSQQNDTSLPRAPTLGELARQRLRGWTKDAFRLSGITQVLLCTTSPTSSLRSMPPPLVGEALAFRDVFQQTQISFIENDTSLPRAPLPGELARQRLRGWTKDAFRLSGITQVLLCTTSPTSSLRSMPPPLVGEALAFRDVFQQTQISFIENDTSLPRAPLLEGLSSGCETERFIHYIYSERSQACRP